MAESTSDSFEVFISHRSSERDQRLAAALAEKLEDRGITYFLDAQSIHGGDSFIAPILKYVRNARIVIVFFDEEMSSWLYFEAACAFFDEKLLPISVDGAEVPRPYSRIQYKPCKINSQGEGDEVSLNEIADEAQRRLFGTQRDAIFIRLYRRINNFFFSGVTILFALVSAMILLGGLVPGTAYEHVNHLHVIIGATVLGGQFFLSLGFARVISSPSFREREAGFLAVEKLLFVWLGLTVLQPLLGLWMVTGGHHPMREWVWLAVVLYLLGIISTLAGYFIAGSARSLDRAHQNPRKINGRYLIANILFLMGFMLNVAVVNLMIKKPDIIGSNSEQSLLQMDASSPVQR